MDGVCRIITVVACRVCRIMMFVAYSVGRIMACVAYLGWSHYSLTIVAYGFF